MASFFTYSYDDQNRQPVLLPADDGAWSVEGVAHAAMLTAHFALEGKIRRRAPYSDKFKLYIGPPRAGSWVAEFFIEAVSPELWAGIAVGAGVSNIPALFKLFRRLSQRAAGLPTIQDGSERFELDHSGTFDALVEAVEPSLIRAHRVVHSPATTVSLQRPNSQVTFTSETRRFIETSDLDPQRLRMIGNVASYNVNARTGRIYFDEYQRTIPFKIDKHSDQATELALGRSLDNYVNNRFANSDLDFTFRAIRSSDGRIKSIIVDNVRFILGVRR